jgi:hypothetical protein
LAEDGERTEDEPADGREQEVLKTETVHRYPFTGNLTFTTYGASPMFFG